MGGWMDRQRRLLSLADHPGSDQLSAERRRRVWARVTLVNASRFARSSNCLLTYVVLITGRCPWRHPWQTSACAAHRACWLVFHLIHAVACWVWNQEVGIIRPNWRKPLRSFRDRGNCHTLKICICSSQMQSADYATWYRLLYESALSHLLPARQRAVKFVS